MTGATMAARIDRIIAASKDEQGRPLTNARLAEMMREDGYPAQAGYIGELRRGVKTNPTMAFMQGFARALKVPLSMLMSDDLDAQNHVASALELQQALQESGVSTLALRAQGLSPQSMRAIQDMLTHLRSIEGLED